MSIIEQIKNEIERRIEAHHTHGHFCAEHEFRDVLSFLSTLESEKPIDGLEEEIKQYGEKNMFNIPAFQQVARHFAQWGYLRAAEKYNEIEYNRQRAEESVPNDRDEAAREYAKTTFKKPYSDNPDEEVTIVEPDKYAGFIAGVEWDREQMMKEAVKSEVTETCGISSVWIKTKQFKPGQKVRVIFIKEEENGQSD